MSFIQIANRMNGIESSPTLRLNALAQELTKQGKDIVNLTAGETDFPTAEPIKDALIAAVKADFTRYTATHGIPELRVAVAEWFKSNWGLSYESNQITLTSGVKQGIFNLLFATINPGDEVLIPAPYWVSYPEMVRMMGGVPIAVPAEPKTGFLLDPQALKTKITSKTRMLILNSPNNPTGALFSRKVLQAIAESLLGTDVMVASDEIYGGLCFDGAEFTPFASLSADAYQRTITFNGLSKSHAMTGWRVGFAAGPKNIIDTLGIIQGQSSTHIPSFIQKACLKALTVDPADMKTKSLDLQNRRDLALGILLSARGIILEKPVGAFYLFPDVSAFYQTTSPAGKRVTNSDSLSEYLLEEGGVAVVPGRPFGEDRCIRISFSRDTETLKRGCERVVAALQKLKR
jgi:aspartate aminotransferase